MRRGAVVLVVVLRIILRVFQRIYLIGFANIVIMFLKNDNINAIV